MNRVTENASSPSEKRLPLAASSPNSLPYGSPVLTFLITIKAIVSSQLDPLYKSVFPIYQVLRNNDIEVAGTCVLSILNGVPLLITAAHVLWKNGSQNPLLLCVNDRWVELNGPACATKGDAADNFDIAYFDLRFQRNLLDLFEGCNTISLEEPKTLPSHARRHFYIFGFPFRKSKYNKDQKLISTVPLDYITDEVDFHVYEKLRIESQENIVVAYCPKFTLRSDRVKTTAPYPHGASGGPLFSMLIDADDNPMLILLEGIMTGWKEKKYIISTRKAKVKKFILETMKF